MCRGGGEEVRAWALEKASRIIYMWATSYMVCSSYMRSLFLLILLQPASYTPLQPRSRWQQQSALHERVLWVLIGLFCFWWRTYCAPWLLHKIEPGTFFFFFLICLPLSLWLTCPLCTQRCGLPPLQQLPEPILSLLAYLNELLSYVTRWIPHLLQLFIGCCIRLIRVSGFYHSKRGALSAGGAWSTLTPASLVLTRAEYWFSTQRARDDLQWLPVYSPDDAFQITADHYSSAADPCRPRAAAQNEERQKEE